MRYLGDQKLVFCLHFFAWNVGPPGLWHCYATAVDTINEVSQDQSDQVDLSREQMPLLKWLNLFN